MHYFKLIGDPNSYRELWENREALEKYLKRLKELMEEDKKEGELPEPSDTSNTKTK